MHVSTEWCMIIYDHGMCVYSRYHHHTLSPSCTRCASSRGTFPLTHEHIDSRPYSLQIVRCARQSMNIFTSLGNVEMSLEDRCQIIQSCEWRRAHSLHDSESAHIRPDLCPAMHAPGQLHWTFRRRSPHSVPRISHIDVI